MSNKIVKKPNLDTKKKKEQPPQPEAPRQRLWIHQSLIDTICPPQKESFVERRQKRKGSMGLGGTTSSEASSSSLPPAEAPGRGRSPNSRDPSASSGLGSGGGGTAAASNTEEKSKEWEWRPALVLGQDDNGTLVEIVPGTDFLAPPGSNEEPPTNPDGTPVSKQTLTLPANALADGAGGKVLLANTYPISDEGWSQCPHDLIHLTHLHEPSVVECLQERFFQSMIYTRTGPIMIALNPFESLSYLYSTKVMEQYWDRVEGATSSGGSSGGGAAEGDMDAVLPHVFETADDAFRQMQRALDAQIHVSHPVHCQQTILVSGESGAGKTVTTKFVMKYLATLSERLAALRARPGGLHRHAKPKSDKMSTRNPSSRFTAVAKKVRAQPEWSMATASSSTGHLPNISPRAPISPMRRSRATAPRSVVSGPSPGAGIRRRSKSPGMPGIPPLSPGPRRSKSPAMVRRAAAIEERASMSLPSIDLDAPNLSTNNNTHPHPKSSSSAASAESNAILGIEQQVLQSNPILESFGNARTVRNDNSSRFGKFIEIQFTRLGKLVGAQLETYLLEKVRLVQQNRGERNYHVFFELLSGEMPDSELAMYHLSRQNHPVDFGITSSGTYDRRDGVKDRDTYVALRHAMNSMRFTPLEQRNIFGVVAAVLHGSNLDFEEDDEKAALEKENKHLKAMCDLMGFQIKDLEQALCTSKVVVGTSVYTKPLSVANAEKGVEALLKSVYGALFQFLVRRINNSIACRPTEDPLMQPMATIGVLDIFGFESFEKNSFEQLCINFCNETLQQQFNTFVLLNEQAIYKKEGIDWSFIEFPENQDVLDLIDKRGKGILNILDDHCRTGNPKDTAFSLDVYKICNAHKRFKATKKQTYSLQFTVEHYAGPVEYTMEGFTEKNTDELPKEAAELLKNSSNPFIQQLAELMEHDHDLPVALASPNEGPSAASSTSPPVTPTGAGAAAAASASTTTTTSTATSQRSTVGEQFRRQLKNLRIKIDQTSPHYIRCLKPNGLLQPGIFDVNGIAEQLRCNGILEAVRVTRAGFAQHYPHVDFVARYGALVGVSLPRLAKRSNLKSKATTRPPYDPVEVRALCEKSVEKLQSTFFSSLSSATLEGTSDGRKLLQMGKSKVFLTKLAFEILEGNHGKRQDLAATKLNAMFRRFLVRIHYFQMLAEYQQDVAERLRREALEREARQLRKQKERERRIRMGLNPDDDEDDEANYADIKNMTDEELEKLKAEFAYNKLREFAQEVEKSSKTEVLTPKRAKNDQMQLKWVCENGQWLRKLVKEDAPGEMESPGSDKNNNNSNNNNKNNHNNTHSDDATSATAASTTTTTSSQPTEPETTNSDSSSPQDATTESQTVDNQEGK